MGSAKNPRAPLLTVLSLVLTYAYGVQCQTPETNACKDAWFCTEWGRRYCTGGYVLQNKSVELYWCPTLCGTCSLSPLGNLPWGPASPPPPPPERKPSKPSRRKKGRKRHSRRKRQRGMRVRYYRGPRRESIPTPSFASSSSPTPTSAPTPPPTSAPATTGQPQAPPWLTSLATTTTLSLPEPFSVWSPGYNGIPDWSRIETATSQDGAHIFFAWVGASGLHVSRVPPSSFFIVEDTLILGGLEASGLVAHDDGGFAVLTRRADRQAYLIRYRAGGLAWERQLTGATHENFVVEDFIPHNAALEGQLVYNGQVYAAYFIIKMIGGHYGDKMVYYDDDGNKIPGGWKWGCSHNQGLALHPLPSIPFASLCIEDWRSGILITTGIGADTSAPMVSWEECWAGYCAAKVGGFVKVEQGFVVAYSTRGNVGVGKDEKDPTGRGNVVQPRWATHQVALSFLDENATQVMAGPILLTNDEGVDHANVHLTAYGNNRLLLTYETVGHPVCSEGTCRGEWRGTKARLLDGTGKDLMDTIPVPWNVPGSMAVGQDGSLIWVHPEGPLNKKLNILFVDKASFNNVTLSITRLAPIQ